MARRSLTLIFALSIVGCGARGPMSSHPLASTAGSSVADASLASASPSVSEAPPPSPASDPTREALSAEIAALRKCGAAASFSTCEALTEFSGHRASPATVAEEDLLFSTLERPDGVSRLGIIYRLANQRGPRDKDMARMKSFFALPKRVPELSRAESKWLGMALGAVSLETKAARDALVAFIVDADEQLAAATVVGIGVAHPREGAALDLVDSFGKDPRATVRLAAIDAYAETSDRDEARACATWATLLSDSLNEVRAAALLSVSPGCAVHHPDVLALAEQRLRNDPNHAILDALSGLCSTKATATGAATIAKHVLTKVQRGLWDPPLRAIALCDPRGPRKALAPYMARKDDIGWAAHRTLKAIEAERANGP